MSTLGSLRVAVVTPYYREPADVLRTCHESVRAQTHPCTHFLVADGHPQQDVARWQAEHITLPKPHHDVGNTPRGLGALSAMNQGYDAVAFLDADNWFYPAHVESMVRLHRQTGAAVCTARRTIHRPDKSLLFTDTECDGVRHVDSSCFFVTQAAFGVLPVWVMMPPQLGPVGDRVFWRAIRARHFSCAHHPAPTVAYRSQYQVHYRQCGEAPPPGAKSNAESADRAVAWWLAQPQAVRDEWNRRAGSPLL